MRVLWVIVLSVVSLYAQIKDEQTKEAIVKIYTVSKALNYQQPWSSSMMQSTGSGAIIGDKNGQRYILTNAHVVANETFLEVQRYGERKRFIATVHAVSHQADLALLKVEDKSFFGDVTPLEFGELPSVEQEIVVYGYPMGGNTLSATIGVVSRIEHHLYAHSGESFLAIQVDAAVNPGNSGGPALSEGKVIGVVMQVISNSQNIGYLVPVSMVKHFIDDMQDGRYDGFPELGIMTQNLENPALKAYYGLNEQTTGKLVADIVYNSPVKGLVKEGDIITHIDGHKIENDGTVEFRHHEYTDYGYYVDMHQMGESVKLSLIREGKSMEVEANLTKIADDVLLVKTTQYDQMPSYFIEGGYIFSPLSRNLILSTKINQLQLSQYAREWPTKEKREIAVLLKVLASDISRGNTDFRMWPIEKVNGETYVDFEDFYHKVKNSKSKYLVFEDEDGIKVVIDRTEAQAKQKEILKQYNIEFDRSINFKRTEVNSK
ncbi:trypsin-like peptidase domain-containing protein [Sulfurovum sp. zt1-1]|uniref:Trypsin-like peptidase domain-containing protein n=1 Tax=Sulfurovum zhangzhouensis TaxID=3019067 RepID=A0ABT7QZH9_9BACT|nr:S1C family serine protease [Sulfurovum zhangzhouensis]MDM5272247.1 trypsin-like peptidase domain-containing protein [Sulfurovum zhangzhouensis]